MPTENKRARVAEIKDRFNAAAGIIMADYRGLTVKELEELRGRLRALGADVKVYKNTLTALAIRELALPSMDGLLTGPTAFIFAADDPVTPAKAVMEFAKDHKLLEVKGGFIDRTVVGPDAIKALASLPTRDVLVAKLMGTMVSPIRGFMAMCNAPASAFARALKAVADQKAAA